MDMAFQFTSTSHKTRLLCTIILPPKLYTTSRNARQGFQSLCRTPRTLVTENKTPAANLHRKTRLLAKCRESGGRSHSALENREEEGILSRAGWGRRSGILNAVAMMSEIRGCQKDNCAPEQPKGVARQKKEGLSPWETPWVEEVMLT